MLFNIFYLSLLSIFNSIQTKSIYSDGILANPCRTTKDCADLVPKRLYRRQINFESLGIQMLGDECESNDQCRRTPVDGTKICSANRCQCSSGHVPIDAYRCIRDLEPQIPSNTQSMKTMETEEPPGYGSLCSKTSDCQHSTVQLECFRGTCACLEGYVPLGKYLCYNIRGQGVPVVESSTLSTTTTTTFDIPHHDMIKSLGQACPHDDYCQRSVSHSHCLNGRCACLDGYISLDQDTCIENSPIVDPQNEDSTTPLSHYRSLLGGQCLTNRDCQTNDARCLNNICVCPQGSFPVDDWNCFEDHDSTKSESTTIISPLTTATTVFHWWPWTPSSTTPQSLIDSKNTFHFRCLLNRQCIRIDENSHCTVLGRCVCNIGYRLDINSKEQRCVRHRINEENCD